ncbi:MAG: tRNA (guanine(26)-N(2))-dimethyltransferase [Candidatus Thermoplasmatota archaeon]
MSCVEIEEGEISFFAPEHEDGEGPKKIEKEVFYNPSMQMNRDTCISFLKAFTAGEDISVLDGMAATGVRGLRILKESSISNVTINDVSTHAVDLIEKNAKENSLLEDINITNDSIEKHLLENRYEYDYIDIDPFGTPVPYYPLAARCVSHEGAVGVTATDTAVLCGTYPDTCRRKYSARPENNWCKHENGLRILIGYCAREAARHDRWIRPLLSYYEGHHFRTYLQIGEGKKRADSCLDELESVCFRKGKWDYGDESGKRKSGPFWIGQLFSEEILENLEVVGKLDEDRLTLWKSESGLPPFFYDTNELSSILKVAPPPINDIDEKLKEKGFRSSRTHFSSTGIKTDAPYEEIERIFLGLSS